MAKIGRNNPQQERREQEAQQARFERGLRRRVRLEIGRTMRRMAVLFEDEGDIGIEQEFHSHLSRLKDIMPPYQERAMRAAGRRTITEIDKVRKDFRDDFENEVQRYMATDAAQNIQEVSSTTRDQVRRIIQRGQRDQLNAFEIRKQIETVSASFSLARSAMIARTEVGIAYSRGSYAAAELSGLELKKQWVSGPNENAREDHQLLDGETINMNEYFVDDFSRLKYPRDPDADASSIIGCRCALIYVTDD